MPTRLDDEAIIEGLAAVDGWSRVGDEIHAEFRFADFVTAFAFMTDVAALAEARGHHPDWRNLYSTVSIALTTHDEGGITDLDLEVAAAITALGRAHEAN